MKIFSCLVLCSLLVLFTTSSYSQQWAADGTIWTYEWNEAFGPLIQPAHFYVAGDTTINGQDFQIIRADQYGFYFFPGDDTVAFTYEENGKAYFFDYTRDTTTVLYDFNAQVGESWTVVWDTCTQQVTVDSIDYINVNGSPKKRLHISGYYSYDGAIIEGIGLLNQLFSPEWFFYSCNPGVIVDDVFIWGLRCFDQPGMSTWNTGLRNDCDVVITGTKTETLRSFQASPNPFTEYILLKLPSPGFWTIEVYSINGQLINSKQIYNSQITIQSSEWEPSVYLIRAVGEEGEYWTQKLIKQ